MVDSVLQPMRELLGRYRQVATAVQGAISALESELEGVVLAEPELELGARSSVIAALEAQSSDVDTLLEFQERLSELPGVLKVTIAGAKSGKSSFIVELADERSQLVICTNCGKTLVEGSPPASHGLCEECRAGFGTNVG